MTDFFNLTILCNGCGKPMRSMGEWPLVYPSSDGTNNIQQGARYACNTCRLPNPKFKKGVPVMASIPLTGEEIAQSYTEQKQPMRQRGG